MSHFSGNKEDHNIAWTNVNTQFITKHVKCAVLSDPFRELLGSIPFLTECDDRITEQWEQNNTTKYKQQSHRS